MILGIYVSAIIANDIMSCFAGIYIAAGGVRFIEGITTVGASDPMLVVTMFKILGTFPTFDGIITFVTLYYLVLGIFRIHVKIMAYGFDIIAVNAFNFVTA